MPIENFLITFASTTAVFRAEMFISSNFPELSKEVEIVAIPYELSKTCYGNGLGLKGTEEQISKVFDLMSAQDVSYKHFWKKNSDDIYILWVNHKEGDKLVYEY